MSNFFEGVPYLEVNDFNADGSLKSYVGNGKPVVVMIQRDGCSHCTRAKPAYQAAHNSCTDVVFATVQSDHPIDTARQAAKFTPAAGVPMFIRFDASGKPAGAYNGNRSSESFIEFGRGK